MLTGDLSIVTYRREGRILSAVPDRLTRAHHAHYPELAEAMLAVYRSGLGGSRKTLHRRVAALFQDEEECPPKRIAAFCKLLDDASTFQVDRKGESSALRLKVFSLAAETHPLVEEKIFLFDTPAVETRERIATELGMPWEEIESLLYRDVLSEQPLLAFNGDIDATALLAQYNVAQVQAAVYRAEHMVIDAGADFKAILRRCKLARLLHEITRRGENEYRIELTGPASVFKETRRYGVSMAGILPTLFACREWRCRIHLQTPWGEGAMLELSNESGLHSHITLKDDFDSEVERHLAEKFTSRRNGWELVREGVILSQHQKAFFPDFTLRHEDGTEVHLEIVGFWTPEYLEQKRHTVRLFRDERILLAVCDKLLKTTESLPADVISYKTVVKIPDVLAAAETLRLKVRAEEGVEVSLRDYQSGCLEAILKAYRAGLRRQLVCLPTGTGKTVIFSEFPSFFKMKKKMLVLAHRSELLDQAREKILRTAPHLRVEIEQGERSAGQGADVVVASVPTLGRESSSRLSRLDPEAFNLIIIDEAHHATAETYRRILDYFGTFDEGTEKLVVGFTATPRRGDGQGLHAVFEKIVFSRALPEMVEAGYLAPVAGYRVETDIDLRGVKSRMGDFVMSQLADQVNVQQRNDLVVDVYKKHLRGRKSICFTVDVSHAECLAKDFNGKGVRAAAVTGKMATESRKQVLEDFRQGRLDVLTNCMVLTEGYDEPSVEGVILARPTRSTLLYTQMIGRGTRLHPGKDDVLVVDIVDMTKAHHLVTLPSLFGLSDEFDLEGKTTQEVHDALAWVDSHRPWVDVEAVASLSELRYRCTHVNLLDLETPEELLPMTHLAWSRVGAKRYRLGLPKGEAIIVVPSILDEWEVWLRKVGRETLAHTAEALDGAMVWAEAQVEEKHHEELPLLERDIRWRHQAASGKQRELLETRKLELPQDITKGQASHLIGILNHLPKR